MPRRRSPVRSGPSALMLIVQFIQLIPTLHLAANDRHPAATILLLPPFQVAVYLVRRWPLSTDTRRPT